MTSFRRDSCTRRRCKLPRASPPQERAHEFAFHLCPPLVVRLIASHWGASHPWFGFPPARRFPQRTSIQRASPLGCLPPGPSRLGLRSSSLVPSAPLPLKMSSTFFSRKPRFSKKEHTSSGPQVRRSLLSESGSADSFAAAGRVLRGVLGLPSQRDRLAGCSESGLCMATSDTRRC